VPCDIGPPAQIPPEAQLARLTHCVANFAFNDPEYWIPGWDLGAPAAEHWMDCQGEYPDALWHTGSAGVEFYNPCNIHRKLDPGTGRHASSGRHLRQPMGQLL